jgi:hypothetical protein
MLLGFISLLLTATSSTIANICIPSKFYDGNFAPCTRSEIDEEVEDNSSQGRKLLMLPVLPHPLPHPLRRILNGLDRNTCKEVCHLSYMNIADDLARDLSMVSEIFEFSTQCIDKIDLLWLLSPQ